MENKEKNFISAVVYVHNAERRIGQFLKMLMDVLEENFENSEIICVNDASTDASMDHIREHSILAQNTTISILHMSYFHGLESAMNAGVDLAIGDFILEFDSTFLDYEKSEIMRVYYRSLEGYDIVSASPARCQQFTSKCFYALFNRFTDLTYKMDTERFHILSRRVINRISSMNNSIPYRKAVYANCGLKINNLVYEPKAVKNDTDQAEQRYRKRLAADMLILFTDIGYRFSLYITVFMMFLMICTAIYSITTYVISIPVSGWTTTILFLAGAFFGLFGILTIIIKYLQLLIDLVFKRKRYSFESIEKLTK